MQTATQQTPKARIGRPPLDIPSRIDEAAEMAEAGATDVEIAEHFGVHPRSLGWWRAKHPAFLRTLKEGKEVADFRVERTLYQKALGYDYVEEQAIKVKTGQYEEAVEVVQVRKHVPADTGSAIFWLKNRDPNRWRDKQEIDLNANVQVEDVGSRDLALMMIQLLRTAGRDAQNEPQVIDHQPEAQSAPVAQDRRRRMFE